MDFRDLKDIKVGSTGLKKVMVGTEEVWSSFTLTKITGYNSKTTSGAYTFLYWTSTGSRSMVVSGGDVTVDYLLVGGGGGGAIGSDGTYGRGGGGGAGGMLNSTVVLTEKTYPLTIGAGGGKSSIGGDSKFNGLTAKGGGFGTALNGGDAGQGAPGQGYPGTKGTTNNGGYGGGAGGNGNINPNYITWLDSKRYAAGGGRGGNTNYGDGGAGGMGNGGTNKPGYQGAVVIRILTALLDPTS